MTLKTLKDLETVDFYHGIVALSDLKQEAIKWINDLHILIKEARSTGLGYRNYDTLDDPMSSNLGDRHAQIKFIKHFFNIKESDLK